MIHFVIGESAAGGLKHAFKGENHQIYPLPLDLSVGPIAAIHEEDGIQRHFDWLRSSFTLEDEYFAHQEKTYRQALEKIKSLKDGDQATIWTCRNAAEQIGLRLICFLTAGKKVELSVINTSEGIDELLEVSDFQMKIRHSGECNIEQLASFYRRYRTEISSEMADSYTQDAARLLKSTSLLRSYKQGKVLDEVESWSDEFILSCVAELQDEDLNNGFVKALRVIGQVFGESSDIYSDSWVDYRLRSLIHSGQLFSGGDLGSIRDYEVRTVDIVD